MQTYSFTVTVDEAQRIINALEQRPYFEVAQLLGNLMSQAQQQEVAEAEAKVGTNNPGAAAASPGVVPIGQEAPDEEASEAPVKRR